MTIDIALFAAWFSAPALFTCVHLAFGARLLTLALTIVWLSSTAYVVSGLAAGGDVKIVLRSVM